MVQPQLIPGFFLLLLSLSFSLSAHGGSIGVNYGRIANNLPSAGRVVSLLTSNGFNRVMVFNSDPAVLRALADSGIKVPIDLPNQLLRLPRPLRPHHPAIINLSLDGFSLSGEISRGLLRLQFLQRLALSLSLPYLISRRSPLLLLPTPDLHFAILPQLDRMALETFLLTSESVNEGPKGLPSPSI